MSQPREGGIATSKLRIDLAGTVSVTTPDGRAQPVGATLGPRGRAAFAYLVLERDRPVSRDELADAVWADEIPVTWRAALRGVVARVRTAVEDVHGAPLALTSIQGCYRLEVPDDAVVDVEVARCDVAVARSALADAAYDDAHQRADAAVAVARRVFLAGSSGRWVERRQAELGELQVEALELASDAALGLGDAAGALRSAETAVALAPLRESAHVRAMIAHARSGNNGRALRAYERCRALLAEELGTSPSPSTETVYLDLLGTEPPLLDVASEPRGNLLEPLTTFVEAPEEMEELVGLLASKRLLTLHGTGGVGKSRQAVELARRSAHRYPEGVWLVELASLADPRLVPHRISSVLGGSDTFDPDPLVSLATHLRNHRLLLVLDNAEHLVEAVAEVCHHLLSRCPEIRMVVTSREPLGIAGETLRVVPPLAVPPGRGHLSGKAMWNLAAVRLFADRATSAAPGLELEALADDVGEICRRLDGLPLAIELAAARAQALGIKEIVSRLDDRFRFLATGLRGAPPRHAGLRAVLDWSHDNLTPLQRQTLHELSVFSGGFTLDAVETVCRPSSGSVPVADALSELVARSLVVVERQHGSVRYRLLDTVRHYADEWLQADDDDDATRVRTRHLHWALALAEDAGARLGDADQGRLLEMLDVEHDNLRSALAWAGESGEAVAGAQLALALTPFWEIHGHLSEGRSHLEGLLRLPADRLAARPRARLHNATGVLAQRQGDRRAAGHHYDAGLTLHRHLGDPRGAISSSHGLGNLALSSGRLDEAQDHFEASLVAGRQLDDHRIVAASLVNLGVVTHFLVNRGDLDEKAGVSRARAHYDEALGLYRRVGDHHGVALALENLGALVPLAGEVATARRLLEESLDIRRQLKDQVGIAAATRFLGQLALRGGDHDRARRLQQECLNIERELGNVPSVISDLASLADIALAQGDQVEAARLQAEGDELRLAGDRLG